MPEISLLLFAYIAFFFPIAAYCLVLATVNRRVNPLMVSGVWDAVGLLLACTGGLLVCGPGIIQHNFYRYGIFQAEAPTPWAKYDALWWTVWAGYYLAVLGGAGLMVRRRRAKTIIYNVDPDQFDPVLARVLEKCRLAFERVGRKVFIGPREMARSQESGVRSQESGVRGQESGIRSQESGIRGQDSEIGSPMAADANSAANIQVGLRLRHATGDLAASGRVGQMYVEPFPTMCHVTLDWRQIAPDLREEIEDELRRNLDECRALENPSAGWFLGISSLLFFFIIAVVVFYLLIVFLPHR